MDAGEDDAGGHDKSEQGDQAGEHGDDELPAHGAHVGFLVLDVFSDAQGEQHGVGNAVADGDGGPEDHGRAPESRIDLASGREAAVPGRIGPRGRHDDVGPGCGEREGDERGGKGGDNGGEENVGDQRAEEALEDGNGTVGDQGAPETAEVGGDAALAAEEAGGAADRSRHHGGLSRAFSHVGFGVALGRDGEGLERRPRR